MMHIMNYLAKRFLFCSSLIAVAMVIMAIAFSRYTDFFLDLKLVFVLWVGASVLATTLGCLHVGIVKLIQKLKWPVDDQLPL